jgi:hypothetical protein
MQETIFVLDVEDSKGIFFSVGSSIGQVLGLMTPFILRKYLSLVPVFTKNSYCPEYLMDNQGRKYGFVFSNNNIFDLAQSYELGFGRQKNSVQKNDVDHVIFLSKTTTNTFVATTIDILTVHRLAKNKKVDLREHRKKTGQILHKP